MQLIGELLSTVYVGGGTPNTTFGAADPVDGVLGLRFLPNRWLSVDAGYRRNLNQFSSGFGDGNGFVAQIQFHHLPPAPPPVNHPPTVTCSASPTTVTVGQPVELSAVGSDPDNDPLTYVWHADQGKITQNNANATWDTTGVAPGTYDLTVHVSDGRGGTADCTTPVTVQAPPPPPNHPPTCDLTADRTSLMSGENTQLHANGHDIDGDTIQYRWSASAGQITGTGDTVTYEADGPGTAAVTVVVDDGKGGTNTCNLSISVQAPPPPPQAQHLNDLLFKRNSSRVDNVAKAQLDDFALKLQNDPKAHGVLIGHADQGEWHADRLARLRAEHAKDYLVKEKKIDASRIEARSVGTTDPAVTAKSLAARKNNQRVEMVFVPEGATF